MIARLVGYPVEVSTDHVILDVGGVGYELFCSQGTLAEVASLPGGEEREKLLLHVYTHVREEALQLFGFASRREKALFLALLKVNGIGPKVALQALSGASVEQILQMIDQGDVKALTKLPKIGKKMAEQIVLTLRGQLVMDNKAESQTVTTAVVAPQVTQQRELSSALVNLGFRWQDVDQAVRNLPKDLDWDESLRRALAALSAV